MWTLIYCLAITLLRLFVHDYSSVQNLNMLLFQFFMVSSFQVISTNGIIKCVCSKISKELVMLLLLLKDIAFQIYHPRIQLHLFYNCKSWSQKIMLKKWHSVYSTLQHYYDGRLYIFHFHQSKYYQNIFYLVQIVYHSSLY